MKQGEIQSLVPSSDLTIERIGAIGAAHRVLHLRRLVELAGELRRPSPPTESAASNTTQLCPRSELEKGEQTLVSFKGLNPA